MPPPLDALGRPLHDLRISVTDRCNFRCTYCMPREVFGADHTFLPNSELLSFDEIARTARLFAERAGVRKLRLTGGEPLLRRDLPELVSRLAAIPGIDDLTLTTNGSLLPRYAADLKAAGLHRVTVSLDALEEATFRRMNDVDFPAARVLEGIDAAAEAGLGPVKVNMVVRRGVNDDQIPAMARRFAGTGHIVRFIEYMDVGTTNGWRMDEVVSANEILTRLTGAGFALTEIPPNYTGEVARRYDYDGGEIGIIASVTRPFCGDCSRARLSADGRLYTCLFATRGHDLRTLLRDNTTTDTALGDRIVSLWRRRADRYSELRGATETDSIPGTIRLERTVRRKRVEMSYIGG